MKAFVSSADANERDFMAYVVRQAGLEVEQRPSLENVLARWHDGSADIIIASIQAEPELEGLIERLRATTEAPLIVLRENMKDSDTTAILRAGADLVLETPVGPNVLVAYCHTLLRRSGRMPAFSPPSLNLGILSLDPSTRLLRVEGHQPQRLTPLEFRLLYALMTHRGQVIPAEVIVNYVWGYSETGSRELVRGLVSRLRAKLVGNAKGIRFIHTVPGVGYLFDAEGWRMPRG